MNENEVDTMWLRDYCLSWQSAQLVAHSVTLKNKRHKVILSLIITSADGIHFSPPTNWSLHLSLSVFSVEACSVWMAAMFSLLILPLSSLSLQLINNTELATLAFLCFLWSWHALARSRFPPAPWAWRRVQRGPSRAYNSLTSCFHLRTGKIWAALSKAQQPDLDLNYVFTTKGSPQSHPYSCLYVTARCERMKIYLDNLSAAFCAESLLNLTFLLFSWSPWGTFMVPNTLFNF